MKIVPDGKRLLVLPLEAKEEEKGGIIIPAGVATADLDRGKVVEVSPAMEHKFKKDDIVLYPSKAGRAMQYNGAFHIWLTEREFDSDIWGKEVEYVVPQDKGDDL